MLGSCQKKNLAHKAKCEDSVARLATIKSEQGLVWKERTNRSDYTASSRKPHLDNHLSSLVASLQARNIEGCGCSKAPCGNAGIWG